MKIAIVGAGIVGVTTAYEFAAQGHEVVVFERRSAAAEESSFANAGIIAPGQIGPWQAPGIGSRLLHQWFKHPVEPQLRWPLSWRELAWLRASRKAGATDTARANRARMQRLAFYSRERLHALTQDLGLEYDCSPGYLVVLRSERERRRVQAGLPLLRDAGVRHEELSPQDVRVVEPAIDPERAFAGALYLPDDGVANCRQVAQLLRRHAQARGARFDFARTVLPLDPAAPTTLRVRHGEAAPAQQRFDGVVMCAGVSGAELLRPVGIRLPLAAVHAYSITAAIGEPLNAPRSALLDARYRVTISRLGDRVRVSGGAEIGGRAGEKSPDTIRMLYRVLHDWFPGAARLAGNCATVQEWKAAHPMLPDGPPVLGASGVPGVWLNLGHGASGWAMACGSARAVADLVSGREPELDLEGLGLGRLLLA